MATSDEIKPGTRVLCTFNNTKGYAIRDEGDFLEYACDAGGIPKTRKSFLVVLDEEVPPAIRSLCEKAELEMRRQSFSYRENHDLEREKMIAEEEVDVCVDVMCDLYAGKQVEYEWEFSGETKKLKMPIFPESGKKFNKGDLFDTCMLGGIIRDMAKKRQSIKDMEDYERESEEGE